MAHPHRLLPAKMIGQINLWEEMCSKHVLACYGLAGMMGLNVVNWLAFSRVAAVV